MVQWDSNPQILSHKTNRSGLTPDDAGNSPARTRTSHMTIHKLSPGEKVPETGPILTEKSGML